MINFMPYFFKITYNLSNVILVLFFLTSCNPKVDRNDPEFVIRTYNELIFKYKYEKAYELLSDTCKRLFSLQDFADYFETPDFAIKSYKRRIISIEQMPYKSEFPFYRYFKVEIESIFRGDTSETKFFITTKKDYSGWSVIWSSLLNEEAEKEFEDQNYFDAIAHYKKILNINPFSLEAIQQLGWSYYRNGDINNAEKYARKALSIVEYDGSYNLLASIYSSKGYSDLAVENYKKAISLSDIELNKVAYLANMAKAYTELRDFQNARETIEKSLGIDSTDTFTWKIRGNLYMELEDVDSAIFCLNKAADLKSLDNHLQKDLYSNLSECLKIKARTLNRDYTQKDSFLNKSKIYILKALELDPDNREFQKSLDEIKGLLR